MDMVRKDKMFKEYNDAVEIKKKRIEELETQLFSNLAFSREENFSFVNDSQKEKLSESEILKVKILEELESKTASIETDVIK
jgi:hypothetical protein